MAPTCNQTDETVHDRSHHTFGREYPNRQAAGAGKKCPDCSHVDSAYTITDQADERPPYTLGHLLLDLVSIEVSNCAR